MSTKLTGYVWDGCAASGMKLSSVAIMARLADFSNDEGVCWYHQLKPLPVRLARG
ncbi:helix-turn-helix domain-containing protein [Escherichia coli]|nr:helix-turn-helix domain-containing protein [Escherichia coli]CAK5467455.1 helix-turn-helix domain-containing protein [Escherichia coli]